MEKEGYKKFSELFDEYDKLLLIKLKPQSYRKLSSNFKLHILPYFKDYYLNDINHIVYMDWMTTIKEKGFKNSYNANLHTTMVGILNYALKFEYVNSNVASKVGGFSKKRNERKNIDYWSLEEFGKFISNVDDEIYKLYFTTLFFTGVRTGECSALTWDDFKHNYLDINKTISKEKDSSGNYIINSPKTVQSNRLIKLDNLLIKSLNEHYERESKKENFSSKWFIFGGEKPLTQTTITRKKDYYCTKANVKKIRLHDFRHSHATLLVSQNVPITVISNRLGHSDTNLTLNTYTHLVIKDVDKAVDKLNEIRIKNNLI